jgi:plasmid stabilization system protein ParE
MMFAPACVAWIGRHVVFYREDTRGILVSRILHQRMLPEGHAIDDAEDWL